MRAVARLLPVAIAAAAAVVLSPVASAISTEAAQVQLQLANLLFTDGRFTEAFNNYELLKSHEDARIRREALLGGVRTSLRLGDFSHAHADGQLLARHAPRDPEAIATYGDALWAVGLFEESEATFENALRLDKNNARGLHGLARSLAARNRLNDALETAQTALT